MRKLIYLAAGVAMTIPGVAHAERPEDNAWVQLGAFRADIDTDVRIDNQNLGLDGTKVDFERQLGLRDNKLMPKISAGVRIGKRFRLEGDYFRLKRGGSHTLTETINIDDSTFAVGADTETDFRTAIYRINVGYSFIRSDKGELGVSFGVHATSAKFRIEADAGLAGLVEEHRSKSFPLPNIGLYGNVALFGPLSLEGRADVLKLKVGDYKGSLFDGRVGLNARFHRNIGVGLAYRYADYDLDVHKKSWEGEFSYVYKGPMAYVELGF